MQNPARPNWEAMLHEALTEPGRLSECYNIFHNYSMGNRILATVQLHARGMRLSPIASFNKWKELGRTVKRGEKALSLIMPVTIKKPAADTESGSEGSDGAEGESNLVTIFPMRPNWFSLDQTEGAPYTPPEIPPWDKDAALAALGIAEIPFEDLNGNAQGYAYPKAKRVAINPVAALPWKTRFHEIAHCLLHGAEAHMIDGSALTRDVKEMEAESVAYLCCASLGLPGLIESRGYIQCWLGPQSKERSKDFARRSSIRIFSAADKILKAGQPRQEA